MAQDQVNFPVDFHHELEGGLPQAISDTAYDELAKISHKHNDISKAMVNIKTQAHHRNTQYAYEITVRLYMDGPDAVATETGENLDGTLKLVFDAVERQVKKQRDRKNDHTGPREE